MLLWLDIYVVAGIAMAEGVTWAAARLTGQRTSPGIYLTVLALWPAFVVQFLRGLRRGWLRR